MSDRNLSTDEVSTSKIDRPRRLKRTLGVLLLVAAALLAWFLVIVYAGWQSGQTALEEKRVTDFAEQLDRQMSLARQDLDNGNFALATRRLEWVLERDPNNEEMQNLYRQAQSGLEAILTPQILVNPTSIPTVTPIPLPTETPSPIEDEKQELSRIRRLVRDEQWEEAVQSLVDFQWQLPSFERLETDQLLYQAYIGLGLQLLDGDQIELGLAYLERAEKLGDLPESVTDHRIWAELYLQGIAFYNVNWAATTYYFRDLCLAAPFYQSSCQRLREALVAYGDQYAVALDWCPAQELYEEAFQYGRSQPLVEKLNEARETCLLATPTPDAASPITGTINISDTFRIDPFTPGQPEQP